MDLSKRETSQWRECRFYWQNNTDPREWYEKFYTNHETLGPVHDLSIGQRNLHTHPTDYVFDIEEWAPTIDECQFLISPKCENPTDWRFRRGTFPLSVTSTFVPQEQTVCQDISSNTLSSDLANNFSWHPRSGDLWELLVAWISLKTGR
jgi:hypothetical protein